MATQDEDIHLLISQNAYLGVIGTFFAITVSVAIARTIIRIYTWRRLDTDDYFFFLAFFSLIISSGLFFHIFSKIYFTATTPPAEIFLEDPGILSEVKSISTEAYVADGFAWVTIFSVKMSFLFYFRGLIKGIPHLGILWWCTLAAIIPIACTLIVATVIVCPYSGNEFLAHCIGGSTFFYREEVMVYYSAVGDIITDAMLISIPILLLSKAQFKIQQKINVGIVLCLSIFMIVIGLVRAISARTHGTNDSIWANFWIQLESYVSVTMVCMTAFRVLFTIGNKHSQYKISPAGGSPRYAENSPKTWRERARRWGRGGGRGEEQVLPEIEMGATMTGMRTWIDANGRTVDETGRDPWAMAALGSFNVKE